MRVLFILHNSNLHSGANLAMLEVITQLKKYNIQPFIVFPDSEGTALDYCKENGLEYKVSEYWMMLLSETDSCIKNIIKLPLLLYRRVKMNKSCHKFKEVMSSIDLVYSNTCTMTFGLMLSQKYSTPHIWHIREFGDLDHRLIYPFGKKQYFSLANKIKSEVVLISKCLYNSRLDYFENEKMHLIYDDVDSKYVNLTDRVVGKSKNILIAGDIKEGKGQLIAAEAIVLLNSQGEDSFTLYIAGKIGDDRYKSKIDLLIEKNGLQDKIIFLGHVSDMNELRNKMDIGIVCSNSEAFGRVTVEGMLSKMAMIGRNSGATPEILEDGVSGLLYDGTAENLRDKLLLLRDKELFTQIADTGFKRAKELYVNGNCSKQIAKLIYATIGVE